jgi:hypothetical protein
MARKGSALHERWRFQVQDCRSPTYRCPAGADEGRNRSLSRLRQQKIQPSTAFNETIKQLATFFPKMLPQQAALIMN